MNENTTPTEQKDSTELARDAINYALGRISKDENIRYHMGAFTEAFERLKKAQAALNGISEEAIEAEVFGRPLKYKAAAEKLSDIKDLIFDQGSESELITKIKAILWQ